jgi:transcriptional regulator with XRE-family HTH domain
LNWCVALRESKGLSIPQLAEQVGVAVRTVYRWERSGLYPRAKHFMMLELVGGKSIQQICPEIFDPTR